MRIVMTTCKPDEAELIADTLLHERLIASCNIIPGITTKVRWKGEALTQTESMLVMRTRIELLKKLEKRLIDLNSFETPEVATLEVKEWNENYYIWVLESTAQARG